MWFCLFSMFCLIFTNRYKVKGKLVCILYQMMYPRQTWITLLHYFQFVCEEGSGDYVARVDEPQSCRYVLTIHTSRTCQHPFLRPPSTAKPQGIVCQPALSAQQYMDYVKAQVCELKTINNNLTQHLETVTTYHFDVIFLLRRDAGAEQDVEISI